MCRAQCDEAVQRSHLSPERNHLVSPSAPAQTSDMNPLIDVRHKPPDVCAVQLPTCADASQHNSFNNNNNNELK